MTYPKHPTGALWNSIQRWLLPALEDELGELDEKHKLFIAACELCVPRADLSVFEWVGNGCPPHSRLALLKAFVAKAVWDFATTRGLIDAVRHRPALRRLCGWETLGDVPSESTFSRAFDAFAGSELPRRILAAVAGEHFEGRLVGHISRDATAIEAREKPDSPKEEGGKRKKKTSRLPEQLERGLEENLADLPDACDWGCKSNSKGKVQYWRGYKLHLDVADGDIPVSFIVTSASLHDSQAAIPLAQMSAGRVASLYDLADAAYDAKEIRGMAERLGHVAIIDHNPRKGEKTPFDPTEAERYKQRSSVERVNSHLHDRHGGRHVMVRGAIKVAAHLGFGLIVIAAEQMFRMMS